MLTSKERALEMVLTHAEEHGKEGEPDHEIGDLQDALREAVNMMSWVQVNQWRDRCMKHFGVEEGSGE